MPKRRCPFPQNTNQMKMHVDMRHVGKEQYQKEVYEKTKNMLLMGSLEASRTKAYLLPHISNGKGKQVIGPAFSKKAAPDKCITCGTVRFNAHLLKCEFCEKKICADCIRVCTGCEKIFCHVCSVINYEMRDEREFCLNCND